VILFVFVIEMSLPPSQNDLVINVGDVHNESNLKVEIISQDTSDDIGGDIVAGVAQMGIVVYCRTAGIPGNVLRLKRDEWDFGFSQGVVDFQLRLMRCTGGLRPGRLRHLEWFAILGSGGAESTSQ
jgi:hypothetical protein